MSLHVLRLGHRINRDQRVSTHCCLVSRAFGAEKIYYSGQKDKNLEESIKKTVKIWGGKFNIKHTDNWRHIINECKKKRWYIIHLTMYGINLPKVIKKLRKTRKNLLLIVGSQKVGPEVYRLADFNIAVGNTPHSEVSSLAIFLHELYSGKQLNKKFKNAKRRIVPQERGKKVIEA